MTQTSMSDKPHQPHQRHKSKARNTLPIEQIIQYAEQGLSHDEIAAIAGVTRSAITHRLNDAEYTPQRLKAYKDYRADILAYYQTLLLNALTPSEINKMAPRDRVLAFGVLYDKERLERGQSTSNISAITSIIQAVHERKPQAIVVSDNPIISIDRPVAENEVIEGQLNIPVLALCPEIEGGRGELVTDSVIIPPYDPNVE